MKTLSPLLYILVISLMISCASVFPPSVDEKAILQRAREDLANGEYDWSYYDMEKYIKKYHHSSSLGEAHLLAGDASRGKVDEARDDKKISGMLLTNFTAPLIQRAFEHYRKAATGTAGTNVKSEALYKMAVMLDIDYMKHFEKALVVYEKVVNKYPGTVWSAQAQVRYENLDDKFQSLKVGPRNVTGK